MLELNGVALDNDAKGWHLNMGSEPYTGVARAVESLRVSGRDGVVPGIPADRDPILMPLKLQMPASAYPQFVVLADSARTLSVVGATTEAAVEVVSVSPTNIPTAEPRVEVDVILRIPGACWRDKAESTSPAVPLTAASHQVAVFASMSAPVVDAVVRVQGPVSGLRVTDSRGSWWEYTPAIPAGSYARFESASGQVFITTTDSWAGGTDVSGAADFNGPRGYFEITPAFTDPAVRQGQLTVTTASRGAGANIRVRGKGAYLV